MRVSIQWKDSLEKCTGGNQWITRDLMKDSTFPSKRANKSLIVDTKHIYALLETLAGEYTVEV